jgi:hypothetical protein
MIKRLQAQNTAREIETIAGFIFRSFQLRYSDQELKSMLEVPLKQLEHEITSLRAYINAMEAS